MGTPPAVNTVFVYEGAFVISGTFSVAIIDISWVD
jgi:hypothetical protein